MRKRFDELPIKQEVQKALEDMGFATATQIQSEAIPVLIEGKDLVAQAPTGTGKTCAFGIPIIEKVDASLSKPQALVLCPTRELAVQTAGEIKKLSKHTPGIKIVTVYGGQPIDRQITDLKSRPQIIIATPGRLQDHLRRKTIKLDHVNTLVLDEADEMLNMGFREEIDEILRTVPEERQTVLFSATLSPEILEITKSYQTDAVKISVAKDESTTPLVEQFYIPVKVGKKVEITACLLGIIPDGQGMIFCNTKKMVDELSDMLYQRGFSTAAIHGDLKQSQRDRVMDDVKKGRAKILIATDVAARGIDVKGLSFVINYDLPIETEYYVHRIGRTGRAEEKGIAYSLVSSRDMQKLHRIIGQTKSKIQACEAPTRRDVEFTRTKRLFDEISSVITSNMHEKFLELYAEYSKNNPEHTAEEIAAALLFKLSENSLNAWADLPETFEKVKDFEKSSKPRGDRGDRGNNRGSNRGGRSDRGGRGGERGDRNKFKGDNKGGFKGKGDRDNNRGDRGDRGERKGKYDSFEGFDGGGRFDGAEKKPYHSDKERSKKNDTEHAFETFRKGNKSDKGSKGGKSGGGFGGFGGGHGKGSKNSDSRNPLAVKKNKKVPTHPTFDEFTFSSKKKKK